jgi:hypothetical protein
MKKDAQQTLVTANTEGCNSRSETEEKTLALKWGALAFEERAEQRR